MNAPDLARYRIALRLDDSFVRELPGDPIESAGRRQVHGALYSRVTPTPVATPKLLAYSPEVAAMLGLDAAAIESPGFVEVLAGNAIASGMVPYAANYGGHQFGNWAGQLGDGRAITLAEVLTPSGNRLEMQLKGAGPTPYSRTADGRAVLRSSIREFLCSEAMHHLGIPTTRALSLVATGEAVIRDMFYDGRAKPEPGAIVCRVAPSFLRFGNFELPAARRDVALLARLVDYTIRREYPHLLGGRDAPIDESIRAAWFTEVCERTARLVAHWMRVGFVHGVMNTDNMSILGLTIDYGPYGWIDNFDFDWTPNTTDAQTRRYRFGQQPRVAYWNLTRLANALVPLFATVAPLEAALERYVATFNAVDREHIAAKLGLVQCEDGDVDLMGALYELLGEAEVDMTIFFRQLAEAAATAPSLEPFADAFYDTAKRDQYAGRFAEWLERYSKRIGQDALPDAERRARMNRANPRYVLRNYLAQQAIDRAEAGDPSGITELLDVMRHPYDDQPGAERFALRRPDWAREKPGCSMLSCSS